MKFRAVLSTILLVGICTATRVALAGRGDLVPAPGAKAGNPDFLGPLASDQWQAPVATVNPEVLIPDDSTNSGPSRLRGAQFTSVFAANAFPSANSSHRAQPRVEAAKPIEKIEIHSDDALSDPPVAAVPVPRNQSKRVVFVGLAGVALLAFRKFRRPKTSIRPKPNFL